MDADTAATGNRQAALWALGDYAEIAKFLGGQGQELVDAAGIRPGDLVLDVGAGTGNASLPAARAGAMVTATDIVGGLLAAGERRADAERLPIRWAVADAQDLPYPAGEFDVVLSCVGAMFAPDHAAVARELLRVCRPGGTVAMANWTPTRTAARFLELLTRYAPPPPGTPVPTRWGDPEYVTGLLGPGCERVSTSRRTLTARLDGPPEAFVTLYRTYFPLVIATYAALRGEPERVASLDADLLAFARAENVGDPAGPCRYEFEYLQVIGVRG